LLGAAWYAEKSVGCRFAQGGAVTLAETLRDLGAAVIFGIAIVALVGIWAVAKLFDAAFFYTDGADDKIDTHH
jgi:hypothetical protein